MSVSEETLRREAVLNACGYRMEWIRHGTFPNYRDFPVFELWRILDDLMAVDAMPESIDSSCEEFDAILVANGC